MRHIVQCVKTLLFLGAGASRFVYMPTTMELVNDEGYDLLDHLIHKEKWDSSTAFSLAKNLVREHTREQKDVEVLYRNIQKAVDAEELHGNMMKHKAAADTGPAWERKILTIPRHNPDNPTTKYEDEDVEENKTALKSLETAIRNFLLRKFMVKPDYKQKIVDEYDKIFNILPTMDVVTTNYDNVLETYCEQKKRRLMNGFKQSHLGDRRIWDGKFEDSADALRLIKLHGSITWQKDGDDILEMGRPGLRDVDDDIMIYPTLGEKDYSHSIFPALWDRFEDMLSKTELLVVVGCSFRDPKINQMLRSRLERTTENPNPMKMLYIDKNTDGLKELVGADVEWSQAMGERGTIRHYYQAEMPYVYAHESEFPLRSNKLELVLKIVDEVSSKALPDHD